MKNHKIVNPQNNIYAHNNGIVGVSFPKNTDPVSTITSGKHGGVSSPASVSVGNISQEMLYASKLEVRMQQFLLPVITIQSVLQAHVYNKTLRSLRKKIVALQERYTESSGIKKLLALLKEDEELKNLLQMYRNLLYKG